jgi:hypothetical protein
MMEAASTSENVGNLLLDYTVQQPRRQSSSTIFQLQRLRNSESEDINGKPVTTDGLRAEPAISRLRRSWKALDPDVQSGYILQEHKNHDWRWNAKANSAICFWCSCQDSCMCLFCAPVMQYFWFKYLRWVNVNSEFVRYDDLDVYTLWKLYAYYLLTKYILFSHCQWHSEAHWPSLPLGVGNTGQS